jgi:hypothetical protein
MQRSHEMHFSKRAVLRERECMPADNFVLIFKCVIHPNLCNPPLA